MNECEETLADLKLIVRELYEEVNKDSINLTILEACIQSAYGEFINLKYLKAQEQQKVDVKLKIDIDKLYELRKALKEQLHWWPGVSHCMRALAENDQDVAKTIEWIAARKYI